MKRIPYYIDVFLQNPKIFFKKALGRIVLMASPPSDGVMQTNIGKYILDTFPSRNYWWRSMYFGYCGVEIEHNIKKFLGKGGIFIDVGAGVGYFSAIASNITGISGQVHCFEPFPSNVEMIRRMLKTNPDSNIILNDYALGADTGVCNYYINLSNAGWECSMMESFIENVVKVIKVRTQRLDNYLEKKKIDNISLIKIDVEGYEFFVLKGLSGFFERTTSRPPIICEIGVPVYKKTGLSLSHLHDYMNEYGYQACSIYNHRKKIDIRLLTEITDVLFMPVKITPRLHKTSMGLK
jgi:FkbM family methyltransferase